MEVGTGGYIEGGDTRCPVYWPGLGVSTRPGNVCREMMYGCSNEDIAASSPLLRTKSVKLTNVKLIASDVA